MTGTNLIPFCICCLVIHTSLIAQDSIRNNPLTVAAACSLALDNSTRLKMDRTNTMLSKQETQIEHLARLPNLSTNLDYGYLSNADIWRPHFKDHQRAGLPHPLTLFTVTATETLYAGGRINNSIRRSELKEKIAFLMQQKDETDIKFLVIANYLDIYRLLNQRKVYINNALLARQRLKNILSLRRQGMVTLSDQLRTELTISDYELTTRKIANSIIALNNELNIVLGLPDSSRLAPDTSLLQQALPDKPLQEWIENAYKENQALKITGHRIEVAATNINILKAERQPEILILAQSDLQRPFLNAIPSIDVYYNIWRAGVGLRYNISSIYQSPRKIKAGNIRLDLARKEDLLQRQDLEVAVKNALIKYHESQDELRTYRTDLRSAEENYRTVEMRYFNQLALLTDLIDATNNKTDAEIKVADAEINTIYRFYQLLKTIGTL